MFSGVAMFGPWGIVIGPVMMIVVVTTTGVYLAVYKGVGLEGSAEATPPVGRPDNRGTP